MVNDYDYQVSVLLSIIQEMSRIRKATNHKKEPQRGWDPGWGEGFIPAIKAVRQVEGLGLRDTLIFMANIFGFEDWPEWQPWLKGRQVDFTSVRGPHAITILKAIAAKHDRLNVSTQRSTRKHSRCNSSLSSLRPDQSHPLVGGKPSQWFNRRRKWEMRKH